MPFRLSNPKLHNMRAPFRSSCPLASTLDIVGDKWSLIIVRDMLLDQKRTFKEFSSSPEGIAPGILSARLKWLESNKLLTKRKLPGNRKENIYLLSETGLALAPTMVELIVWGDGNLRERHPEMHSIAESGMASEKSAVIEGLQTQYRQLVASLIG